ncbi:MAG TPA: GIY-YIG nuclease family protein, partial [Polyangiaceae bacterium]
MRGVPIDDAPLPTPRRDPDRIADAAFLRRASGGRESTGIWCIYVVQPSADPFVKIGQTWDVLARMRGLQTANPRELELLVVMAQADADGWDERSLHYRFRAHHERFEWFRLEGGLLEWLRP